MTASAAGEAPESESGVSGWALRLRNVNKAFEGVQALEDVSFSVRIGEIHCLAGENGCGKSTLIKIVTGVYSPDSGTEIEVFGERHASITPALARTLGISVIWQDLALFPHMTVAENIAFDESVGLIPKFFSPGSSYRRAEKALNRLRVDLDLSASLNSLPIAKRQIVAIARALHGNAKLIFMDEPTSSLTQSETDNLLRIVKTLSTEGVSVVFVSHRLAEVIEISSRLTVLRNGRLVGVYDTSDMTQTRLGSLMTGQELVSEVSARDCSGNPPVLEIEGLSRSGEYSDVSLKVRSGEIVGVIGLIGAGRTELAHSLIGMTAPDSGSLRLNGRRISPRSVRDAISAGIAYVSEDRLTLGLIQQQSISANVVITVLNKILGLMGLISPKRQGSLVSKWIDELAIQIGHPDHAVSTLSGGNQQRVVLAKWLTTSPRLLILDSPTVGVDVGARAGIFRIARKLADEGIAILLISDEVHEVHYNSDRVLHMRNGRIVWEHDPASASLSQLEARVYA